MSRAASPSGAIQRIGRKALVALAAASLIFVSVAAHAQQRARLVIGGKAYTEQYVLAEITRQMLEREGLTSQVRVGYATDQIREAQLAGKVHITWDYSWTGYAFHLGNTEYRPIDEVMQIVRSTDRDSGLIWLERSDVDNSYAFAVNLDFAAEACIHSMADLAEALRNGVKLRLASDQECHKREDCLLRAQRAYDFQFDPDQIQVMNVADTYEALRERRADVAVVYRTDGKIPAYDLELLEDPEQVFVQRYLVPVVREDVLRDEPRIRAILEKIARALDTATSQDLHYRVDVIGQTIPQVAEYFITSKGL